MAIKDVFDKFENDDFIAAKDELSAMMQDMTNKYIKTTLGLQADPLPREAEAAPGEGEGENG